MSVFCIILAVTAGSTYPENVDHSVELGNEFTASCPVNKHVEGSRACSEIPTVHVSDTRNSEEGPFIPVVSPLDDSAVRVSITSSSYVCPEVSDVQDPLTCEEACGSSSDGGFYVTNRRLEIEVKTIFVFSFLFLTYGLSLGSSYWDFMLCFRRQRLFLAWKPWIIYLSLPHNLVSTKFSFSSVCFPLIFTGIIV